MKQKLEGRYPASSDVVIKMMTDRKFYTDRLELQGLKEYEVVEHKSDGKNFSITIKRKVGPIAVTSVETWNVAKKTGTIKVELADWDIHSKVPLVGGKIEKQFAGENEKAIPEQTRLGIQLLKNYA
jgi:hypothetical protein